MAYRLKKSFKGLALGHAALDRTDIEALVCEIECANNRERAGILSDIARNVEEYHEEKDRKNPAEKFVEALRFLALSLYAHVGKNGQDKPEPLIVELATLKQITQNRRFLSQPVLEYMHKPFDDVAYPDERTIEHMSDLAEGVMRMAKDLELDGTMDYNGDNDLQDEIARYPGHGLRFVMC